MSHASAAHPTKVVVLQISGIYLSTLLRTANISYTTPGGQLQSLSTTPHTMFEISIEISSPVLNFDPDRTHERRRIMMVIWVVQHLPFSYCFLMVLLATKSSTQATISVLPLILTRAVPTTKDLTTLRPCMILIASISEEERLLSYIHFGIPGIGGLIDTLNMGTQDGGFSIHDTLSLKEIVLMWFVSKKGREL